MGCVKGAPSIRFLPLDVPLTNPQQKPHTLSTPNSQDPQWPWGTLLVLEFKGRPSTKRKKGTTGGLGRFGLFKKDPKKHVDSPFAFTTNPTGVPHKTQITNTPPCFSSKHTSPQRHTSKNPLFRGASKNMTHFRPKPVCLRGCFRGLPRPTWSLLLTL